MMSSKLPMGVGTMNNLAITRGSKTMKDGQNNRLSFQVPRTRVELAHPFGYYTLNVARLPFRHLGLKNTLFDDVVNMNHAQIVVIVIHHKDVGDLMIFHHLQRIHGEGVLVDRFRIAGHDVLRL